MSSNIGEKMKKLRLARNLSQLEVAEAMGVSRQYVSRWESGERNINADQLMQYADVMQVTLDYFRDDSPRKTMHERILQLEFAFNDAGIPEADIDKAYQDIMKIYLKSKEARAENKTTAVESYDLPDLKEE